MPDSFNPFSLSGKTILVTGASSGIGRGIAISCSMMGARVIINGRNTQKLSDTLSQMSGDGHEMVSGDLTDSEALESIVNTLPKLDGIVHSAGIGTRVLCKNIVEADIDQTISTNFKAPVLLQTEILKKKKLNKGGSIVFIASMSYDSPSVGNALYAASKGALNSLAVTLAKELAPKVRVNCISPGTVETPMTQAFLATEAGETHQKGYPLGVGHCEDITNLVCFLLSDASRWITGQNIIIDGGRSTL